MDPPERKWWDARVVTGSLTDAELVARCLEGDRASWAELLRRYADLVYGLLRKAGLDETTAADVFQEVAILLWKNLKRLRRVETLVPWIATTTTRLGWRVKKRAKSRAARDVSAARPEADPQAAPPHAVEALEEEQAVRRALASLGARCRELLEALYFRTQSPSYDDLAAQLGMSRGSIGPTRQRCLEGMRKELS